MKPRIFLCRDPDGNFLMFGSRGDEPEITEMGYMVYGTGVLLVDAPQWFGERDDLTRLFPRLEPGQFIELTK